MREDSLEVVAARGFDHPNQVVGRRFSIPSDNPNSTVVLERKPVILEDAPRVDFAFQEPPFTHIRSWLGVPLIVRDKVIGMLSVDSAKSAYFNQENIRLVTSFADQAAIAIDNAELYQQVHKRAEELGILYEVVTAAMSSVQLDVIFDRIMVALHRTLSADSVSVILLEGDELVTQAWIGFSEDNPPLMRRSLGMGVPGWVAQNGEPLLLPDVSQHPRYHSSDPATRSELCVPLRVGPRIIGTLNLESRQLDAFSQDDLRLLSILAGHLAAVVENARLLEELEEEVDARTVEIRAEQEKSEVILRNVGNAIAMVDPHLHIQYINPEFTNLTGYQSQDVLGREMDLLAGGGTGAT